MGAVDIAEQLEWMYQSCVGCAWLRRTPKEYPYCGYSRETGRCRKSAGTEDCCEYTERLSKNKKRTDDIMSGMDPKLRESILAMLRSGENNEETARAHAVSVKTVAQVRRRLTEACDAPANKPSSSAGNNARAASERTAAADSEKNEAAVMPDNAAPAVNYKTGKATEKSDVAFDVEQIKIDNGGYMLDLLAVALRAARFVCITDIDELHAEGGDTAAVTGCLGGRTATLSINLRGETL